MGIVSWIVFGLVAGVLAKLLMPGHDPGGLLVTMVIGIAGVLIGGFIGTQLGWGDINGFDLPSLALAVGGAVLLLLGFRYLKGRKA